MGTDTANHGRRRFTFHSAINAREPAPNWPGMAGGVAYTGRGYRELAFHGAINMRELAMGVARHNLPIPYIARLMCVLLEIAQRSTGMEIGDSL